MVGKTMEKRENETGLRANQDANLQAYMSCNPIRTSIFSNAAEQANIHEASRGGQRHMPRIRSAKSIRPAPAFDSGCIGATIGQVRESKCLSRRFGMKRVRFA
jgi:hypothetical protein